MRKYPESYNGPRAGQSTNDEWVAVRDYDAFCYVRDGTWTYSDFDCYLYSMCEKHRKIGEDNTLTALKEVYKILGIS